jgi:hypothetical protein
MDNPINDPINCFALSGIGTPMSADSKVIQVLQALRSQAQNPEPGHNERDLGMPVLRALLLLFGILAVSVLLSSQGDALKIKSIAEEIRSESDSMAPFCGTFR